MAKCCWLARQYKKGWKLAFCIGNDNPLWLNLFFKNESEVNKALNKAVVFVHMAENPTESFKRKLKKRLD